ncbi:MAG: RHS repeat protein, partial [Ketobacter sp.]|nr:RHS repeat protein [Ketobacter sp.]
MGNRWDCFYNEQNQQIERLEASWGAVLEFQNSDKGLIQSIRERTSEGHKTLACYHYSPEQDLIAIEDAGGDAERFAYQNHIITQRTLRTGFNFYFQWDQLTPQARCLRQWGDATQPGAAPTYDYRFEWDTQARLTRSTDSNGGVREVHYDKRGQVIRETDPLGHTTHYEYDRHGRKIKTIDALGFEHNFYYDEVGNPTGQTDSAGGGFTLLYDEQHRPTCFTDAEGNSWAREYNDDGLISKTIDADGNETQYFYNALGLPELILDPAGQKQILAWSPTGQLLTRALEGPAGATEPTHYQYDAHGHVAQVQQGSHTTGYQHNAKGDVTAIHYPDGSRAGLAYNANRQLTAYTDPLGRTTRFEYDGLAQITRRIDPAGNSLHYHYDRERNLIGLTNENGEHYQLKYDANERLIEEIGFDGRVQQYEYNPLGQLTAHIEGRFSGEDDATAAAIAANTTRFERDPMGRLLHKHTPDGSDTTFSYDKNGRLASASNAQRTLTFAYTPNGQLQQETQDQHTLQHRYDPLGNRIATELPNGNTLGYQYDPFGQFTALDYNGNRLTQLQRNQHGQEIARTQGNLQAGYDYDPAGRLTRHWVQNHSAQSREAIIDRQYHYDSAGRLGLIDDLRKGRTQYHYDALDRLKAVEGYSQEQFEFDPAGNILSTKNSANNQQNGSGNVSAGNRLAFHGDRHFTYDERGNLTEER